ncbi:MAG: hypothetical protein GXO55_11365 [Chloroflexi bacterium]|nr:hypothetical protein [Chloroflexota bacterium]
MGANVWLAFVLGLLVGWLIEWIIDWVYWRRKCRQLREELEQSLPSRSGDLWSTVPLEDDLQLIKGIGPVISKKLNDAGITTFAQLAELTVAQLEEIIGEEIKRLADEEEILRQARELANRRYR